MYSHLYAGWSLVSGSLSGIWLNTQQVRGLGLAGSTDDDDDEDGGSSSGGDEGGVNEGVMCSEKECWEDIVVKVE